MKRRKFITGTAALLATAFASARDAAPRRPLALNPSLAIACTESRSGWHLA